MIFDKADIMGSAINGHASQKCAISREMDMSLKIKMAKVRMAGVLEDISGGATGIPFYRILLSFNSRGEAVFPVECEIAIVDEADVAHFGLDRLDSLLWQFADRRPFLIRMIPSRSFYEMCRNWLRVRGWK
jgi:hypothetical protein